MSYVISWLIVSVMFFAIGEYFSKSWALQPTIEKAIVLVIMYVLGTVAWLPAIYRGQIISIVGTIWSVMSLLTTLFVGIVIFHETLTLNQLIGMIMAFLSIILLSI